MGDEAHRDALIQSLRVEVGALRHRLTQLGLDKLHEGEPVYVVRAQDVHAPHVIRYWAALAQPRGTPLPKIASAHLLALEVEVWQRAHAGLVKVPD